jgi:hypothetical protein
MKEPKYFMYISPEKVEMLYSQIPKRTLKSIGAELKFDLKLFSATFKEDPTDENLFSKTILVAEYLKKNKELIGTNEEPKSYIFGKEVMDTFFFNELKPPGVLFLAHRFSLGGSLRNVIGYKKITVQNYDLISASDAGHVTEMLEKVYKYEFDLDYDQVQGYETATVHSREYEYLAKVLHVEDNDFGKYIIGSPIYVSIT